MQHHIRQNRRAVRKACSFEVLEGRTLMSATILGAPTLLTATVTAPTTIQLNWKDNGAATGYNVLRSTDGKHYTLVGILNSATANSYTDHNAASGQAYDYEVDAFNGTKVSGISNVAVATTPLAPVSGLTAVAVGPTSVTLKWTDNDTSATGYEILHATDGLHFTQIATMVGAKATTYTDNKAMSGHANQYKIVAFDAATTAPACAAASAVTPLIAPTNLTAALAGLNITLTWTDADTSATGYSVYRSTDNVHFTLITTLNNATAKAYTDTNTTYSTTYYYRVTAFNAAAVSAASSTASKTTPGTGVSIATRYGDELVVTAAGAADSVSITESGSVLTITADGQVFTDHATAAGLFVYTRGGADTINIAGTVTADTILETIDGALTTITSAGTDLTAWIDSTDVFSGTGFVHRVASFAGGVSKALGVALANPIDAGPTAKVSATLFGTGPVVADVNQGEAGDCYFLSSLAAFAQQSPQTLMQSAVDMGDGTYTVQFISNNKPVFVRVSNAFSTGPFDGFKFAQPGADGSLWAPVMEKAWAFFRDGANTYASTNGGWMGTVYTALGVNSTTFIPSALTQSALYNLLSADLATGKEVTLGTGTTPPNLVGSHAYTLISAYTDGNGVMHYIVRNPWGVAGDAIENSQGYATLTFAQMVANFVDGCAAA
jgi:fibronectin type 3 domain-containing protein